VSKLVYWLAATILLIGAPTAAQAHLVDTRLGDFYGGMLHPLTAFEEILPWLALAILAAFQGPKRARWLLAVFPLGLLAGGILSLVLPNPPFIPALSVALIAITGLAVAAAINVPLPVLIGLAAVMGLVHGYQNGREMTVTTDQLLFISGVTAIGYAVVTMATGSAIAFLKGAGGWRPIALRASGSWVAAVGILVLGLQFLKPGMN
jgi:hydrogenase/urease accessory protein HupE